MTIQRSENMPGNAKGLQQGYPTLTPYLTSRKAVELIEFVKAAFGATELYRGTGAAGGIHADVVIGNSKMMLGGGASVAPSDEKLMALHLYVEDADAVYRQALKAGAISAHEPVDQAYGDREAAVKDMAGNPWYIATHRPARGSGEKAAARAASHIPDGLGSVTPFLHTRGAAGLIEFVQKAFGAEDAERSRSPDGTIHYAKVRIGDSALEVSEAHGEHQPLPSMFYVYVTHADATYRLALAAGASSVEEPADQNYGHRRAAVKDAFGNLWYVASDLAKGSR
jgi:PhnB protein